MGKYLHKVTTVSSHFYSLLSSPLLSVDHIIKWFLVSPKLLHLRWWNFLGRSLIRSKATDVWSLGCYGTYNNRYFGGSLFIRNKINFGKQAPSGSSHGLEVYVDVDGENTKIWANILKQSWLILVYLCLPYWSGLIWVYANWS